MCITISLHTRVGHTDSESANFLLGKSQKIWGFLTGFELWVFGYRVQRSSHPNFRQLSEEIHAWPETHRPFRSPAHLLVVWAVFTRFSFKTLKSRRKKLIFLIDNAQIKWLGIFQETSSSYTFSDNIQKWFCRRQPHNSLYQSHSTCVHVKEQASQPVVCKHKTVKKKIKSWEVPYFTGESSTNFLCNASGLESYLIYRFQKQKFWFNYFLNHWDEIRYLPLVWKLTISLASPISSCLAAT